MTRVPSSRRDMLRRLGGVLEAPLGMAQARASTRSKRPPIAELITTVEFEDVAKATLPPAAFAAIAGGDRTAFDRMTLRPRMCIPTVDLDLSTEILGAPHFTPILVGPVGAQQQFHQDAERATVRGAGVAKAAVVISSKSSVPIADLAKDATSPLWYSIYADGKTDSADLVKQAVAAGCKAVCVTVAAAIARDEWTAIEQVRKSIDVPVLVKGIRSPRDATTAIAQGAKGIIVSTHGAAAGQAPIEMLSSIVEAVDNQAVVLIDGNFRRGTDILKALILGARGVLVSRPVMWGLASYGAEGVQAVVELLQNDLARHVAAIGVASLSGLTRTHLKIHRR